MKPVIKTDPFDTIILDNIVEESAVISGLSERSQATVQDTFLSLYKQDPMIAEDAEEPGKRLMETLHSLPEYQSLRNFTRLDDVASALGTARLGPALVESAEAFEKEQSGKDFQKLDQAEKDAKTERFFDRARRFIRKASAEAEADAEQWQSDVIGFGINPGELAIMSISQKLELAEKFKKSKDLRRILDLIGRMKNFATAASEQRTSRGMDEIIDVGIGAEIARLLPVEYAKFKRNKALFAKDLYERNLLVYNLQGVELVGRGPIIFCIDVSASMQGERSVWAKAMVMASLFMAEKQKRTVHVILFDTGVRKEWTFVDGKASLEEKLDVVGYESDGGGTAFYPVLSRAFSIRKQLSELKPADVTFITDGESKLTEAQVKSLTEEKGDTRLHSVFVGVAYESDQVKGLSDFVYSLSSFNFEFWQKHSKTITN